MSLPKIIFIISLFASGGSLFADPHETTALLYQQCVLQHTQSSPVQPSDACAKAFDQVTQASQYSTCIHENAASTQDVVAICNNYVAAYCARDNYDEAIVTGCSQYGSMTKEAQHGFDPSKLQLPSPVAKVAPGGTGPAASKPNNQGQPPQPPSKQAADPAKKVTPSSPEAQPKDPAPAGDDSSADIQSLQSLLGKATSCCRDPVSCGASSDALPPAPTDPNDKAGLTTWCNQMKQAGLTGASNTNSQAAVCHTGESKCETTGDTLISKYQSLQQNCAGTCASKSIYDSTLTQLQDIRQSCVDLGDRVRMLGVAAMSNTDSASASSKCQAMASASPQSAGGNPAGGANLTPQSAVNNANDPYGCQSNPSSAACQDCSKNPGANCKSLAAAAAAGDRPTASFSTAPKQTKLSDFNVASPSGLGGEKQFGGGGEPPAANRSGTVANNTGGSIPGAQGGTPPASAGSGRGGGGGMVGSAGYSTDIDQGTRSGGGYTQPAGQNAEADSGAGGFGGYGGGGPNGKGGRRPANAGMDLKQYLPGHAQDPRRAGGMAPQSTEIAGKFSDIWRNISVRFQEKCRLGELVECH